MRATFSDSDAGATDLGELLMHSAKRAKNGELFWPFGILCRLLTRDRIDHVLQSLTIFLNGRPSNFTVDMIGPIYESAEVAPGLEEPIRHNEVVALRDEGQRRLRILAILLLLDRLQDILDFVDSGVTDADLPLEIDEEHSAILANGRATSLGCLLLWRPFLKRSFLREQFSVKTKFFEEPTIDTVHHYRLDEQDILPFLEADDTRSLAPMTGAFGEIVSVIIDPLSHNFQRLLNDISIQSRVFAVKQLYSGEAVTKQDFWREVSALRRFNGAFHNRHLVTILTTYEQNGRLHIVFPLAKGSLPTYWRVVPGSLAQPTAPDTRGLQWLAAQILGLAEALKFVQNPEEDVFGIHGDVKPSNILWYPIETSSETSSGRLVLSDFGASTIYRRHTNLTKALAVTATYRPPEFDFIDRPRSRTWDIWSFGCVLLEMVCWVFDGIDGVTAFSADRMSNMVDHFEDAFFKVLNHTGPEKPSVIKVKEQVTRKISALHADPRCSSYIHKLLDLIEHDMLIVQASDRASVSADAGDINLTAHVAGIDGSKGDPVPEYITATKTEVARLHRIYAPELVERLKSINSKVGDPDYLVKPASWSEPQKRVESSVTVEINNEVPRMLAQEQMEQARVVGKTTLAISLSLQRSMRIRGRRSIQLLGQAKPGLQPRSPNHPRSGEPPRNNSSLIKSPAEDGSLRTDPEGLQPSDGGSDAADRLPLRKQVMEEIKEAAQTLGGGFLEGSDIVEATFNLQWELRRCIETELDGDAALSSVFTISGDASHAWATSCGEYVSYTWGELGTEFLETLSSALGATSPAGPLDQNVGAFKIHLPATSDEPTITSTITFSGEASQVPAMAQLLVWIAVTFRLPPRSNKLSSSTARFTATSSAFSIQLEQLDELKDSGPGICWTALFPSTVVADGFPVPLVPDMFGLQVPLGIIVELAEIMQDVTLEDDDEADAGTYLDGIRWRLYPTKYDSQENTVQWHLSRKALGEDPNHPSFAEDESAGWLVGVKPETLANATAIVGYCSQVAVQLGTESRLRLYKRYRTSGARFEKPPAEAAPSSATLGGSVLGHLMASITTVLKFKAGLKYSVADIKGMSLKDILDHSAKEPIILFETELGQERGWMVPQLSLIHEAYNYWAFREAKKTGKAIPYAALWDEAVKNAEKEPEPEPEPEGDPDEAKERERRKKAKPIDAEGEIKKIYTAIHNRVVQNAEADEEAGPSVRLGQTPMPGWDWLDLTDSWSVSRRRDARRDGNVFTWKQKPSWLRLTRYVPVFLGRGMEQVIVPVGASAELVCGQWQPVPGGFKRNYLVAYVECLRSLAEKNGNLDVWRLIDDIAWKFTDAELFEPCKQACLADRTKCPKQPQHLCKRKGDKKKSDTLPAPGVGAVIFGAKRKSEKQLTKMPAAVGEEEEEDEEEAVVEAVAEEEDEEAEVEAVAEAELEEEGEGEDGPPVPAAPGIPINHEDPAGRELVAAVGIAEALGDPLLPFGDEGALPVPSPVPPNPGNGQERRRKLADNVHIFDDEDDAPPAPENVQVNNRKPVVDAQVENQDDVPQAQEKVRANNRKPTTGAQVFDNHDDALPVPGNVQVNKRNLVDAQVLDGKDDALLAPGNDQENDRKLAADARVFGNKDSAAADPALKVDAQESQPVVTIQVLMLQCEGVGRWLHDNWHLLVITILIALLVRKYTE